MSLFDSLASAHDPLWSPFARFARGPVGLAALHRPGDDLRCELRAGSPTAAATATRSTSARQGLQR